MKAELVRHSPRYIEGVAIVNKLLALALVLLVSVGCSVESNKNKDPNAAASSSSSGGSASDAAQYRIAVIPKGTSHQFWQSVHYGAQMFADEHGGVEIIWEGPAIESDTQSQIAVVKNMITNKVDGICIAPNHSSALKEAVSEANDENIPVVIFDSGLAEGPEIVTYVATDNFKGGQLAADAMAKALGGKGDVILLRYRAGSESTEQREEGFLKAIAEHPLINVISSDQYGEDTTAKSKQKVNQLLQLHKDADGIFAVCESNANGTLEALRDAGVDKKVKFIAFDSSAELIRAMNDGGCQGIVLQNPVQMGYQSAKALIESLEGREIKDYIPTGEYVATPENMEEEKYKELLNPKKFGE